jgi:hypothetical protein
MIVQVSVSPMRCGAMMDTCPTVALSVVRSDISENEMQMRVSKLVSSSTSNVTQTSRSQLLLHVRCRAGVSTVQARPLRKPLHADLVLARSRNRRRKLLYTTGRWTRASGPAINKSLGRLAITQVSDKTLSRLSCFSHFSPIVCTTAARGRAFRPSGGNEGEPDRVLTDGVGAN